MTRTHAPRQVGCFSLKCHWPRAHAVGQPPTKYTVTAKETACEPDKNGDPKPSPLQEGDVVESVPAAFGADLSATVCSAKSRHKHRGRVRVLREGLGASGERVWEKVWVQLSALKKVDDGVSTGTAAEQNLPWHQMILEVHLGFAHILALQQQTYQ